MQLAELKSGLDLVGLEPERVCTVMAVVPHAENAVQVIYRLPDGTIKERLLGPADEATIAVATVERPWAFDGDAAAFQLACEANRIDLAFLFDPMMAVHTSNVEPLPHQITAVYESMLPRQPLRYVLADDPGAGKTIMAGLYIRELIMRADARRVLIVAPGSLVEQWRDELFEKFGLEFRVYSSALEQSSPSGNPFEDHHQLIVRLDQMSRNDDLRAKLCAAGWDLVVFDEAHKLAAHYYGREVKETARFKFAKALGQQTRHLLLMTATPHNGKEEDFQLFLSLLDSDRFYGKFRDGVHKVDVTDLMRRMVKEELVKFDGTPLFPERKAYTVNYTLSDAEAALYEAVTRYVSEEMGKADQLAGARKGSVGFALTTLQRRLASSPEAIYQSLKRRRKRLSERLRNEKLGDRAKQLLAETVDDLPEDDDDLTAGQQESLEENLVDQATAAKTITELEAEIDILTKLEQQARAVVTSGQDRKWDELSKLLQNNPQMHDESGRQRKIIIFSEHRDTLNYLHAKIAGVLGNANAIVTIHGGINRDDRLRIQALFRSDPEVRVLVATDAAGEGVNLQCAHLMVNYDLPWNPNRLEQRFGRIHRIGQTEVCHLWSLVAKETREGAVWYRLLEKIATECEALKGKVFNILGDVFEEKSLKELMIEAIRYGDQPEVRARLTQKIDHAFDHDHLRQLLDRNALAQETMSPERLFKVKEEMEKAEARRLQPYFVRSFFLKAFVTLGGIIHRREADRWEITHVPDAIRERYRRLIGRNRREQEPILKRYERICFTREAIQPLDKPGLARAVLIHPGHPLMLAVTDMVLEQHANLLRHGAVLVDPADDTDQPWLLFLLTHEVKSGDGTTLSKRMQFIRVNPDGSAAFAGWAPHLDLEPGSADILSALERAGKLPTFPTNIEQEAISYAAAKLVPDHYDEVANRRIESVEKTLAAVHDRLTKEIAFWTDREIKLRDDLKAGKDVRLNLDNVTRTLRDLEQRLDSRKRELQAMRQVQNGTPVILGGALVVPAGLLRQRRGERPALSAAEAAARKKIETLAMQAVIRAEEAKGHRVVDVSAENCGWDLTSYPPPIDHTQPDPKHIEVKGRMKGADTLTVTRNEILYAFNQGDMFVLAIVFVNPDDSTEGPYYLANPFQREPDWGAASVNYNIAELLKRARGNS
ncbi:helicase domain protein [Isosphaera pallida ATCC 43644]|uniref:Helicase domain protein n=1 Tax=Isosphaera pallida (strain ATCC 43644 / DSM 9630 / IS1B) TaxID=575540 RepID=E8R6N3_ISOPI|nr:helicase-related protein [Isosphaera pallida]ADV63935.1 helicase domain protein [Isosphaera pallida ATCC 43644]